jgi:hypothetical protein
MPLRKLLTQRLDRSRRQLAAAVSAQVGLARNPAFE